MLKRPLLSLALLFGAVAGLRAEAAPAPALLETGQPQAVSGASSLDDPDVYYAPEESGDASGVMGASQGAVGSLPGSASYLSHARLLPFDWSHPDKPLPGVELFLGGQYLGNSPLSLDGFMVQRSQLGLSARKDGYEEATRAHVKVPVEGDLKVALLGENAASWYTTPAWIAGLGLLAGSVAVYNGGDGRQLGLGLAAGGVSLIALSQLGARFFHLPALRREVDAYNAQTEPAP